MQVPRSVQLGGLAALALADVALVIAIMRPSAPAASDTPATTTRTTVSSSPTTATPSPTSTPTTGPVAAMAVVDDRVAYRAAAAGCGVSAPGLEKSVDGGRTWEAVRIQGPRSIVRVEFTSATEGFVIGTDAECRLRVWRTSSGGEEWAGPTPATEFWSTVPADSSRVNAVGRTRTPCVKGTTVVQVARVTDADTWVLCSKGVLRHTTNGGAAWSTASTVAGARAVTVDRRDGTRLVLAGTDQYCPGTRIWSLAPTAKVAAALGCVPTAKRTGPLALDAGGSSVWLSLDRQTWLAGADLNAWSEG